MLFLESEKGKGEDFLGVVSRVTVLLKAKSWWDSDPRFLFAYYKHEFVQTLNTNRHLWLSEFIVQSKLD